MNTMAQLASRWLPVHRSAVTGVPAVYLLSDRLHDGRSVRVPSHQIADTVSGWLAELDVHSPLVTDLAHALCAGNWPTAYKLAERLSVEVCVAA